MPIQNVDSAFIAQEETLIRRINQLTERAMPPTSQIVRNLA